MVCPCVGSRPVRWAGLLLQEGLNGAAGQTGLSLLEDDWSDWRFRNVCDPALLHIHRPANRSAAVLVASLSSLGFLPRYPVQ